MYEVIPKRSFLDDLKRIPKSVKEKIKIVVEKLKENPFSLPYKKLRGYENLLRIRIGEYRLIYSVDKKEKKVYLIRILHRQRVYENL